MQWCVSIDIESVLIDANLIAEQAGDVYMAARAGQVQHCSLTIRQGFYIDILFYQLL